MPQPIDARPRTPSRQLWRLLSLTVSSAVVMALGPPPAAADRVYHSEHLRLSAIGGAPLRSGFVENMKAQGPRIYAHENFHLNGADPRTTYVVTRDFFFLDPGCDGNLVFHSEVATLRTNGSGNARGHAVVRPADVAGFEGTHGVMWTVRTATGTVRTATGTVAYQTSCTDVTLD